MKRMTLPVLLVVAAMLALTGCKNGMVAGTTISQSGGSVGGGY
jgi:predicted small secreted protein